MAVPGKRIGKAMACALLFALGGLRAEAFSLLGPLAPWMKPEVGFVIGHDVGGPRNLGDEFRWNVPTLTYGFDAEFKNFFGEQGIAAMEEVMAHMNRLAPASEMDPAAAPREVRRIHSTAQSMALLEFRTMAQVYVLEQLGLANPIRFTWVVNSTNAPEDLAEYQNPANEYVIRRNLDPLTLEPTSFINDVRYSYVIKTFPPALYGIYPEGNRIAFIYSVDQPNAERYFPFAAATEALAINPPASISVGVYYPISTNTTLVTRFTRDDVGGLRYLLRTNNVNMEITIPGVRGHDGTTFVDFAARPGVDKITFQRFDVDSSPIANVFTDVYIEDGAVRTQKLERTITRPDILFTAANHPRGISGVPPIMVRKGPNFSHTNETGSGVFLPGVTISFQKLADVYQDVYWDDPQSDGIIDPRWALFNSRTTTPPVIFPVGPEYQGGRTLSVRKVEAPEPKLEWRLRLIAGVQYAIESSSDLQNWNSVTTITAAPIYDLTVPVTADSKGQFFRARRISHQ